MARISSADAKRLGLLGRSAGARRAEGPAAAPGASRTGRKRAMRVVYPDPPVEFSIPLPFDPRPKERPRTVMDQRRVEQAFVEAKGSLAAFRSALGRGASRTFTPKGTKDYEALVSYAARAAMRGRPPLDCPIDVTIEFTLTGDTALWPTSAADGDGDNLEKAVLDALNGIVFVDDRQVVRSVRAKTCGPAPAVRVRVAPAAP